MATDVDEPEWVTIVRLVERFAFSLRDHTPYVINQGTEGSSMAIVSTDMVATIHRMSADIGDWLELSPQIAIDRGCKTLCDFQHLLTELGIESVGTYPYIRGERPAKDWSESFYMLRKNKKYRIHGLKYFSDKIEIIRELIDNFKLGGKRFPIMADMFMGHFMDLKISQEAANENNPPFHTNSSSKNKKSKNQVKGRKGHTKGMRKSNENEGRKVKHTLLIVGMNIMADNPDDWFCVVKSSFGEDWGEEGFSRVGLEVFESIYVPVYDPESVVSTPEEETLLKDTSKSVPVYLSLPCYNEYMKQSLKNMAAAQECLFCSEIPDMGGYYDSLLDEVPFFHDEKRFKGRFFLNWYCQELIKHVDRVLARARLVFQGTSLVIKLPTMSCASELTAGYYNTPENDLCHQILMMLKKHNVGVYHTLGDTDYDSFASKVVTAPFPISGGNALPCSGKEGFDVVLGKAKCGPYSTFVYNALSPNMMEAQQFKEFEEFVTEMHR